MANWFACTGHCALERAVGFPRTFATGDGVTSHASCVKSEESQRICDWVLSGGYAFSATRVTLPQFNPLPDPALAALFRELASQQQDYNIGVRGIDPPIPTDTFLFVCRTALPVRAPSFLS